MTEFTDRDLGKVLADIEYLKRDQTEIKNDFKEIKKDLSDIKATLSEARGHWKALLLFGSFCAFLGGLLVQFFSRFKIW